MPNLDLKYITDENGNRVLPITHVNAVRDSSGNTLPSLMAPEKNGSGIGICSTSSGTALTVSLTGYNLVQNGIVAVTFENDVPANATLNINSKGAKPIIYKGSAIEADTIKADDTVTFAYDGTNYVLCSSGAGGSAPVNPNETVNISLTQVGGNSADLTGASITITDDDSQTTLLSTTWQGSTITAEIDVNTNYTVSVETITGYLTCKPQSYQAAYQGERFISFQYRAAGAFIEAIDGGLYASSTWGAIGKTANAVVVLTDNCKVRLALTETSNMQVNDTNDEAMGVYIPSTTNLTVAKTDYNGVENTANMIRYHIAHGNNNVNYAAPYCANYTFPDGVTKGCLPSTGQMWTLIQNKSAVDTCLAACGGTPMYNQEDNSYNHYWCSDLNQGVVMWTGRWGHADLSAWHMGNRHRVRPVAPYV